MTNMLGKTLTKPKALFWKWSKTGRREAAVSAKEPWRMLGFRYILLKMITSLKQLITKHKKLSVTAGTVLVISMALYLYAIQPIFFLYSKSKTLEGSLRPIMAAINRRDIKTLDFELKYFRREILEIKNAADRIGVFRSLPWIGPYAADLKNGAGAENGLCFKHLA